MLYTNLTREEQKRLTRRLREKEGKLYKGMRRVNSLRKAAKKRGLA